jgi:hypothetical protein
LLMRRIAMVFVLILFCFGGGYAQDTSCGIVWYPPIQLSPDSLVWANTPIIAAQGDTIHVTYDGADPFFKFPYHRSVDNGKSFEPLRSIVPDSVGMVQPISMISSMGKLYAFFELPKTMERSMKHTS